MCGWILACSLVRDIKGPREAVLGHKIVPDRFKTTYRSMSTNVRREETVYYSLVENFFRASIRLQCVHSGKKVGKNGQLCL